MSARRFVLLDRDGTINVGHHYLSHVEQVELLPDAAAGLRAMRDLGFGLAVITNQSAIGRGYFDEARLGEINRRLSALLAAEGVQLDGIYYCPHAPEDDCACRKPRTALAERAAAEHGFDPRAGFVIGDNVCDIGLGARLGATTILVRTGHGARYPGPDEEPIRPDYTVDNLAGAARLIAQLERTGDHVRHRARPGLDAADEVG